MADEPEETDAEILAMLESALACPAARVPIADSPLANRPASYYPRLCTEIRKALGLPPPPVTLYGED